MIPTSDESRKRLEMLRDKLATLAAMRKASGRPLFTSLQRSTTHEERLTLWVVRGRHLIFIDHAEDGYDLYRPIARSHKAADICEELTKYLEEPNE